MPVVYSCAVKPLPPAEMAEAVRAATEFLPEGFCEYPKVKAVFSFGSYRVTCIHEKGAAIELAARLDRGGEF